MVKNGTRARDVLWNGLLIGLSGGMAEVGVVCGYTALTGGDAAAVGQGVASAVGLHGASAGVGLAVHMGLAVALGTGLYVLFGVMRGAGRPVRFMLGSLSAIWAVNFFVLLPILSPGFVHILPYAVTLASKLAFGLASAGVMGFEASAATLLIRITHRPALHHAYHPAG